MVIGISNSAGSFQIPTSGATSSHLLGQNHLDEMGIRKSYW